MNRGYATLFSIVFLGILAVLGSTAVESSASINRSLIEEKRLLVEREKYLDMLDSMAETFASDTTPFIDSPSDEIWHVVQNLADGTVSIALEDISSALNINSIGETYLRQREFNHYFSSISSVENLSEWLSGNGPMDRLEELVPHIASGKERLFTLYGYWNPYVADATTLGALFSSRGMADAVAEQLATVLIVACRGRKIGDVQLRGLLGEDEYDLTALLTTSGLINIHFADPELLRSIMNLQYAGNQLPNSIRSTEALLTARQSGDVSLGQLESIIERKNGQDDVLKLLGCETWFWRITIAGTQLKLTSVLAKTPTRNSEGYSIYQVVSRVFEGIDP